MWLRLDETHERRVTMEQIIKGKPLPTLSRKGAQPKYPWGTMQPGDAFRFPMHLTIASASSMANQAGHQWQMKFVVRKDGDGSIWCWRVDGTPYEFVNGNVRQEIAIEAREYQPEIILHNPMELPPIQKTASELRVEEINREREENLRKMGESDPI